MTARSVIPFKAPTKRLTAQDIAERCEGAKQIGARWQAKCPAHDDQHASLSISTGEDGRILLHCHAECPPDVVLLKIGLTFADLMPPTNGSGKEKSLSGETIYNYLDAEGKIRYQSIRYYKPDGKHFYQRQPDGKGGWIKNITDPYVEPLPYRLPSVLEAVKSGRTVYIVEGEKDVDNLRKHGFIATTNSGGAGKWSKALNDYFQGADVVIIPDNDEPGRKHSDQVAHHLSGIAQRIRVLILPNVEPKGDVSDWLDAGGTSDDLKALTAAAPDWEPRTKVDTPDAKQTSEHFPFTKTRDVLSRPKPTWLYGREIPTNALVTLTAASGSGKTFIAIDYAMNIAQKHKVLYVAAERAYPALMRGVAWLDHHQKSDPSISDDNLRWIERPVILTNPNEEEAIKARIKEFKAEFVVIDTISRCMEGLEENSNTVWGVIMGICDRIKTETGATIMVVHHTGWEGGRERGGSKIRDYAEVAILAEMDKGTKTITITCNKMSSADEFEPRQMRIIPVGKQPQDEAFGPACVIPAQQVKQTSVDPVTAHQRRVLEVLDMQIFAESGAKATQLFEILPDLKRTKIYQILNDLVKFGFVSHGKKFDPWQITANGKQILGSRTPTPGKSAEVRTSSPDSDLTLNPKSAKSGVPKDPDLPDLENTNGKGSNSTTPMQRELIEYYARSIGVKWVTGITGIDLGRLHDAIPPTEQVKFEAALDATKTKDGSLLDRLCKHWSAGGAA